MATRYIEFRADCRKITQIGKGSRFEDYEYRRSDGQGALDALAKFDDWKLRVNPRIIALTFGIVEAADLYEVPQFVIRVLYESEHMD